MITTLKKQFPTGFAWLFPRGYLSDLVEALAIEPDRVRDFLQGVVTESNPGTATYTQEEWFQQFGLSFQRTLSLSDQQAITLERYLALGGQDIVYIQDQVNKAGFTDIIISENGPPVGDASNECGVAITGPAECWSPPVAFGADWIFYYNVTGTVDIDSDTDRLFALLQRIAPGHLIPNFSIDVANNVCGPAECGVALCDG